MNISSVSARLRHADLEYVLGRFRAVRAAYSGARHLLEWPVRKEVSARYSPIKPTIFPGIDIKAAVQSIRDEAVFVGLQLPTRLVEEIKTFALAEPLHAIYDPFGPTFSYSDVTNGVAADGRRMPIGGVRDPARCPAIREIMNDPILRRIVHDYLGHEPRKIITILNWTFASSMSDDERRNLKHGVIDYHYDVGGFDFVYANFYITDTDRHSGAHVMMKRSHNKKPLRMLFGSAKASQEAVYKQYGAENEIVIEAPAGTGFVQDTSCYHRATSPTRGDRLMLALRFIN